MNELSLKEKSKFESYYRNRFWNHMLSDNKLNLDLNCKNTKDAEGTKGAKGTEDKKQPIIYASKWDVEAVSALSKYLSRRQSIGKYQIEMVSDKKKYDMHNFISIGADVKNVFTAVAENGQNDSSKEPCDLSRYINDNCKAYPGLKIDIFKGNGTISAFKRKIIGEQKEDENKNGNYEYYYSYSATNNCMGCITKKDNNTKPSPNWFYSSRENLEQIKTDENGCRNYRNNPCPILAHYTGSNSDSYTHNQLGQMLMWRDKDSNGAVKYYVSLVGVSGPATSSLALLLVNTKEKSEETQATKKDCEYALSDLQEIVREKLIKNIIENLDKLFPDKSGESKQNGETETDTNIAIEIILNSVLDTLEKARGIEALYEVSVSATDKKDQDTRKATDIKALDLLSVSVNSEEQKDNEEKNKEKKRKAVWILGIEESEEKDKNGNKADPEIKLGKIWLESLRPAVKMYLNSTFYKYFFPLISDKEINRIKNGLQMYLSFYTAKFHNKEKGGTDKLNG